MDSWCGSCPKCAFVYLSLYPFLPVDKMKDIFGRDLFEEEVILTSIHELVGFAPVKPFECVGSVSESRAALVLSYRKREREKLPMPPQLKRTYDALPNGLKSDNTWIQRLLQDWNREHFVPIRYATMLKDAVSEIVLG